MDIEVRYYCCECQKLNVQHSANSSAWAVLRVNFAEKEDGVALEVDANCDYCNALQHMSKEIKTE